MRIIIFFLCMLLSVDSLAGSESNLNGTWVPDLEATERSILDSAPRHDAKYIARNIGAPTGFYAITKLVVDDDSVTFLSRYGENEKIGKKYNLVSQDDVKRKYVASDDSSTENQIKITIVSSKYIRVRLSNDPVGNVFLWKRTSSPQIKTKEDLKAHLYGWQEPLKRIKNHFLAQEEQNKEAKPPIRWSEYAALHDGRRVRVEREWSYTLNHSRDDTDSELSGSKEWIGNQRLKFKHPNTGRIIEWQGNSLFAPVLMDFIDGVPFLILWARPKKESERIYGCTELPFIYLQYDSKSTTKWRAVSEDDAPHALQFANLSVTEADKLEDHMTTEEVQETIVQKEKSSNGFFQRDIPRGYKEWRYKNKNEYRNERQEGDCRPSRKPLP